MAARIIVIVAVLAAVGVAVAHDWAAVKGTVAKLSWVSLAASFVSAALALFATMKVWHVLLAGLGSRVHTSHASHIYFTGQLARYVPGSVWAVLMQAHLGRAHRVPRIRAMLALLLAVMVTTATGLTVTVFVVPTLGHRWGSAAMVLLLGPLTLLALTPPLFTKAANLALRLLRRPPLERAIPARSIAIAAAWSFAAWALYGLHLFVLAHAVRGADLTDYPRITATLALAVCAGFLAFLLPSGIGVREAVIVAGLAGSMSAGSALAVALMSRLLCALCDVLSAAVASIASRVVRQRHARADRYAGPPIPSGWPSAV